ncbi:HlyD family secretion protein [Pelistega ratti]|uniref:HlyD family secretion protein n=1 Tax=Pelistega ratti TaxID=2652177 RepID=UPI00191577E2|nr:HlyD family efflux transporter periplasmic adaptor subunit [Pelistega ratti]
MLFRQEALDNRKWKSRAILDSKIPAWVICTVSFSFIIFFILYLIFGSYTRKEAVLGEIVTDPHAIILPSLKSGYISEVIVSVNQSVQKGQALFKIKVERVTDRGNIDSNSIAFLQHQIEEIEKTITLLKENKEQMIVNMEQQLANNRSVYQDTKNYLEETKKTAISHQKLADKYRQLLKQGIISNDEYQLQVSRYFQSKDTGSDLQIQLMQLDATKLNLLNDVESKKMDFDNQILQYAVQKSNLQIRLMELEASSEIVINSPSAGKIESVSVTQGQMIRESDTLAQIIPATNSEYKLIIWVPNSAIPFVKENDKVSIRYESFPFEKFGQFKGVIESISTLPATAQELSLYKNVPLLENPNNSLYKVIVLIDDQIVRYQDKQFQFINGMKAEVTLFLENRKLYEWIFKPIHHLTKNME